MRGFIYLNASVTPPTVDGLELFPPLSASQRFPKAV
jgi:hypothetical protein